VKELYALKGAIDQARQTVQKAPTHNVFVKEEKNGGPWDPEELFAKPATLLGL
jgi:hypothetical protein